MRRTALALGFTLLLGSTVAAPAVAAPDDGTEATCRTGIVGVDGDQRLTTYLVEDGVVKEVERSGRLPFDPTDLGFISNTQVGDGYRMLLDAPTSTGQPRQLVVTDPETASPSRLRARGTDPYVHKDFSPELFVDTWGYYVYTVKYGHMVRYNRIKEHDGDLRYGSRRLVRVNARGLVSLQHVGAVKVDGKVVDVLVGTTKDGGLTLFRVQQRNPNRAMQRTLASDGFDGVTDISVGYCNDDVDRPAVHTINPTTGTASWLTIRNIRGNHPAVQLRGEVTGAPRWDLHAVI